MNMEAILSLMNITQVVVKLRFQIPYRPEFFGPFLFNYIDEFILY